MLRMAPSGWEPLGFSGVSASWFPPSRDPTDPGAAADWEYAGVAPTTATNMLMRLSVMTHLHDVVAFIGSLQGFETWSHDARVLRNHLFKCMRSLNASLVRSVGCCCGMLHRLALVPVSLAEKLDRFFTSEMGWSEDVGPIDGFAPNGLCRF